MLLCFILVSFYNMSRIYVQNVTKENLIFYIY